MFSKLFTPKLQHPDPDKRLAALKALASSDQDIAQLSQLVLNDPDSTVRDQALSHLCSHITDQTIIDDKTAMNLFKVAELSMKEKFIVHIKDEDCLDECIASADNQQDLILLASKSILPQSRKKAAENVSGLDNLKHLQLHSNDKNVMQLVRQKINVIKAQQKASDAANQTLKQICEALERLSKSDFEPMMISRVNLLESHWMEVADQYKSDFISRYEQANDKCRQIIRLAQEEQALAELAESQNEVCRAVCEDYESEISQLALDSVDQWPQIKDKIEQQWSLCSEKFSPATDISERFYTLKSAVDKIDIVIDAYKSLGTDAESKQFNEMDIDVLGACEDKFFKLTRQLSWPFNFRQPELFVQIKSQQNQVKCLLREKKNTQRKKLAQIDSKITGLKSHIRQKNLIKANRMLNYIENLIDELPETLRHKEHDKMNTVIISLNELRGLNEFVTQPKKIELCEQMEALITKQIPPEKLIETIKNIQAKWKSLATSDAQADDVLWERFKQAADQAYLPCAAYLENLEKIKNQNLAARAALNEQLEKQLDEYEWDHVDWKKIQALYTHYWKQWRSLSPVFFSQNKPHQKKFESAMAVIKNKLDAEKNENHQICEQLIDRVIQLAESLTEDNVDDAIEQVKRIQVSWKNVGITHFNKSSKQWKKFQKCCDQVFEFQRQKHKSRRQQENKQIDQVHELVNKIKSLIKLPDEKFAQSQADYQALVEAFEVIELPNFHKEKSQRLFSRTCDDYQSHLAGMGKRNKQQTHKLIRQAAELCCKAESLAISVADRSDFNILKAQFDELAFGNEIKEKLNQRIETASSILDNVENLNLEQCNNNEQVLLELAIKLEVLFDLQTPEYALKQRMEYQLQQLQSGLKPALSSTEKQTRLLELELDWYQVGAVSVEARKNLEQRLAAVIKQAEN